MADAIHGEDPLTAAAEHAGGASPFPRWQAALGDDVPAAAPDAGALFMPLPGEGREDYLDRLRALQMHLEALIGATRRGLQAERPTAVPFARPLAAPEPVLVRTAVQRATSTGTPPAPGGSLTWPATDRRRALVDRRAGSQDRRLGLAERRRGRPDTRLVSDERRAIAPDRRVGPVDRRRGADRRRSGRAARALAATSPVRFDMTAVFWAVQVVAWTAVALVVLVYGLGN
jgi:hypothetical protein